MSSPNPFNTTEPQLLLILSELTSREPIFHRPAFASTHEDFARMTAPTYWEVGASGRRYSRDFILQTLADTPPIDAAVAGWQTLNPQCRRLGPENSDTYLLTYTLHQSDRQHPPRNHLAANPFRLADPLPPGNHHHRRRRRSSPNS